MKILSSWKIVVPILALLIAGVGCQSATVGSSYVYVGTYTGKVSKGIYRSKLDLATGALSQPELVAETANPTYLAVHPNQKFLYAINETGRCPRPSADSTP